MTPATVPPTEHRSAPATAAPQTDRQLHYPGDHTRDIVGRVMGPTTLGQLLTVIAADYDETADTTTAHLRPSTVTEVETARQNGGMS